jgi:hypothetical protein
MRGVVAAFAAWILFLAIPAHGAGRVALLVDESGSMQHYYDDGTVRALAGSLAAACSGRARPEILGFTTELRRVGRPEALVCRGANSFTLIDRALQGALASGYERIWILTDNVEDSPTAPEAGSTRDFYEVLRNPRVSGVVLFPILQAPGRGGLVLYGVQATGADPAAFANEVAIVHRAPAFAGSVPLRMKPFDRDVVGITITAVDSTHKLKVGGNSRIPLRVRFISRLDHLRIAGARIAPADTPLVFPRASLFSLESGQAHITPEHVTLEPGAQSATLYDISIDLGRIRLKPGYGTLWNATFGRTHERYRLDFRLDLAVPRDSFELRREILARYGAESMAEARATGHVYALANFPALAGEQTTVLRAGIPLPIDVEVPPYASIIVLGSILLGLGLAGALAWVLAEVIRQGGGVPWTMVARDLAGATKPVQVESDGTVRVERTLIGRIRERWFEPAPGCRVPGAPGRARISPAQPMRVMLANGKQIDLSFTPKGQHHRSPPPPSAARRNA